MINDWRVWAKYFALWYWKWPVCFYLIDKDGIVTGWDKITVNSNMSSIVVHLCYMYCYAHKMILSIDSFLMLVVHAFCVYMKPIYTNDFCLHLFFDENLKFWNGRQYSMQTIAVMSSIISKAVCR